MRDLISFLGKKRDRMRGTDVSFAVTRWIGKLKKWKLPANLLESVKEEEEEDQRRRKRKKEREYVIVCEDWYGGGGSDRRERIQRFPAFIRNIQRERKSARKRFHNSQFLFLLWRVNYNAGSLTMRTVCQSFYFCFVMHVIN